MNKYIGIMRLTGKLENNISFWKLISLLAFLSFSACGNPPNSVNLERTNDEYKTCIEYILAADDSLGKMRNHACEEFSLSKTIEDYTASLRALDWNACPIEFTSSFEAHIKAWENMTPVTNNYDSLRGEMHDLFDIIAVSSDSTLFNERLDHIWSTWDSIMIIKDRVLPEEMKK